MRYRPRYSKQLISFFVVIFNTPHAFEALLSCNHKISEDMIWLKTDYYADDFSSLEKGLIKSFKGSTFLTFSAPI